MKHHKLEFLSVKEHPEINEAWIQQIIADDPTILGLGDVILRDKERSQLRAGRLDLLFQDPNTNKRYEVEVQLGPTDESHIIRTIEYWDLERKRYPQYDHCAVIIAEDVTNRFLNVISLFNGHIPLIAIQMRAIKLEDGIGLLFTKILDEFALGLVDEDEEVAEPADREYWLKRGSEETVALADKLLSIIKEIDPLIELKYNKFYIGLAKNGIPNNFVSFKPKKKWINVEIRLTEDLELNEQFEQNALDFEYLSKWGKYRLRLRSGDIDTYKQILKQMFQSAYEKSNE